MSGGQTPPLVLAALHAAADSMPPWFVVDWDEPLPTSQRCALAVVAIRREIVALEAAREDHIGRGWDGFHPARVTVGNRLTVLRWVLDLLGEAQP